MKSKNKDAITQVFTALSDQPCELKEDQLKVLESIVLACLPFSRVGVIEHSKLTANWNISTQRSGAGGSLYKIWLMLGEKSRIKGWYLFRLLDPVYHD